MVEITSRTYDGKPLRIMKRQQVTAGKANLQGDNILRDLTLLTLPYDKGQLRRISENSDILHQCIDAYVQNTVGFGIDTEFTDNDDTKGREKEEDSESNALLEIMNSFSFDRPVNKVLGELKRHVEECGDGFLEVQRNQKGEVVGGETLQPEYMQVTKLNDVEVDGQTRRFRYFVYRNPREDAANKSSVWYKSFGDPTPLNADGSIAKGGNGNATEVMHIKLGDHDEPYGVPRYIGVLIKILGSRKADELNYRYFTQGRHVPLAIVVSNGQLTKEAEDTLSTYANDVGSEELQHKFMVLDAESKSNQSPMGLNEKQNMPSVKIEHLADVLQKDALFLDYNENVVKMVLSAFRLPPVYVGLSSDYNRATVETAKQTTEEQVFQPERVEFEWYLNKLFEEYGFKHTRLVLKTPNLTNADDTVKVIQTGVQANALAPNDVRPLLSRLLNEPLAPFDDDTYNYPAGQQKVPQQGTSELIEQQLTQQVAKAYGKGELAAQIRQTLRGVVNEHHSTGTS
ncbi:phage portal protein [Ligilactobacillus acidipiscis]